VLEFANNCTQPFRITFSVTPPPTEVCTYTQGFYGNQNGTACMLDDGSVRGYEMVELLLSQGPLVLGLPGTVEIPGNSVTFVEGDGDVIKAILPGGGSSTMLSGDALASTWLDKKHPGDLAPYLSKLGRIEGQLFAQTLTLGLNLRIETGDDGLAAIPLQKGMYLVTQAKLDCEKGSGVVEPQDEWYEWVLDVKVITQNCVDPYKEWMIPSGVLCMMEELGKDMTVGGLYELANEALGGKYEFPYSAVCLDDDAEVSLDDIASAVDMINNAFDGCRVFAGNWEEPWECQSIDVTPKLTSAHIEGKAFTAYPNPFSHEINFEFVSAKSGHATLEIMNIAGQRVARIMDQYVKAEEQQKAEFRPDSKVSGMYFYKLDIEGDIQIGKVVYRKE